MQTKPMRLQRMLVVLGFILVAAGQLIAIAYWSWSLGLLTPILLAVGYLAFAFAGSAWLRVLSSHNGQSEMRWVLQIVAVASFLWGTAYTAQVQFLVHLYHSPPYIGTPPFRWALSYLFYFLGFCLAAAGFWSAATVMQSVAPSKTDPPEGAEPEPVAPL